MNKGLPILLTMTILNGIALSSTIVSADSNEVIDTISLTVPIACTMSGTGTTHTATLNPGTYSAASGSDYESGIGKTTLTAICNDDNGFSIYAIGYTGNEYGVTNLVGSNTNGTIATKAYASGDTSSNWSMKLTKVDNPQSGDPVTYNPENLTITTNYDNWIAVPATYTKVAQYKANTGSSTTDTTLGVKLETTYAAYIASNQAADTYVGQVKYTMIHPYNAVTPTNVDCNPNASTILDAVCMQDFTASNSSQIASTMTLEQQYTLKDKRDGKSYTIAKLADGNVWMTQNLDLDLDSNTLYSNTDTDIGWNSTTNSYDTATWIPSYSTFEADDSTWHSYHYNYNPDGLNGWRNPLSHDPGDLYWTGVEGSMDEWFNYLYSCDGGVCDESLNPTATYVSDTGIPQRHLGNYYNWVAAIASNGDYPSSPHYSDSENGYEFFDQSICPAGWTMPRAGVGEDTFYSLLDEYGLTSSYYDSAFTTTPLFLNLSEAWSSFYVGALGEYWTPVIPYDSYPGAFSFTFSPTNVYAETLNYHYTTKENGMTIRCLARPVSNTIELGD